MTLPTETLRLIKCLKSVLDYSGSGTNTQLLLLNNNYSKLKTFYDLRGKRSHRICQNDLMLLH